MKYLSKRYCAFFAAGLAFVLFSCFAPLDGKNGNGSITIGIPGRSAVTAAEAADFSYAISLTGPGGEITHLISRGQSLFWSVSVLPGLWTVMVRAYTGGGALRGTGYDHVMVTAGDAAEARITLTPTTAVYNYAQLAAAFETAGDGELILVCGDVKLDNLLDFAGVPPGAVVTLAADAGTRTITRGSSYTAGDGCFFLVNGDGNLVLGAPGSPFAAGTLVLDGGDFYVAPMNALIVVLAGSQLIMNDNTVLQNNDNGASSGGGGVLVDGVFTMNGGTIRGNSASSSGGGVLVNVGVFTMNGGTIRGNRSNAGGGVLLAAGDGFYMNGGTIQENTAPSGPGASVRGTFTMSGNALADNVDLATPGTTVITITGDLTHNPAANITGGFGFSSSDQILGGSPALVARNYRRFRVSGGRIDSSGKFQP
ncbi:MAG: hypothetical protein LBD71_02720 [Treponema sp.]|jgi:hypothetical protein|nr:hypothetical protein [Treponema sp.]